jgi:hypothetical protein
MNREKRVVLAGVLLALPGTYLVYTVTGSFELAGATLLGVGFVVPSGINGYLDDRDDGEDDD